MKSLWNLLAVVLFGAALSSCVSTTTMSTSLPKTDDANCTWQLSHAPHPLGAVILLAGLNNRPEILEDLAATFRIEGYHTAILALRGQRHFGNWTAKELRQSWSESLRAASVSAKERFPNLPLYALGYSLGASIIAESMHRSQSTLFSKAIFLAPAISLRGKTSLLKIITPLSCFGLSLPSLADPLYRAESSTPLRAYQALFQIVDELENVSKFSGLHVPPVLIVMSRKDELVSFHGTGQWIQDNNLKNFSLEEVLRDHENQRARHHLIVDSASLGPNEWSRLTKRLLSFLKGGTDSVLEEY